MYKERKINFNTDIALLKEVYNAEEHSSSSETAITNSLNFMKCLICMKTVKSTVSKHISGISIPYCDKL